MISLLPFLCMLASMASPSRSFTISATRNLYQNPNPFRCRSTPHRVPTLLGSSFYGNFDADEDEEEDDDDEDDDFQDLDDDAVADFRSKMSNLFGDGTGSSSSENAPTTAGGTDSSSAESKIDDLITFARSQDGSTGSVSTDWSEPVSSIQKGMVLLANPEQFCSDFGGGRRKMPSPKLLAKFGLTLPPPADLGPDRRADLLPVLIVVECGEGSRVRAVLLNRRTGYLLGDLEQADTNLGSTSSKKAPTPVLEKFCIQPLWFGGVDNVSAGLDMLHQCPTVPDAEPLSDEGLYWGGDPALAQDAMDEVTDKVLTGFDFKFFVQSTVWGSSKELQKEIDNGTWFTARVSKEVLFKSRDRMGTRRAKPLWTEVMELLGGKYKDTRDMLYDQDS
jgi:hypothetical protein